MQWSLGPLEKMIMDVIWEEKKASVALVCRKLKCERKVAYTTVMTIMGRLVDKGWLVREREGKKFVYASKRPRKSAVQMMVSQTIRNLVDRFGEEAVVAFWKEARRLKDEGD